MTMPTLEPSPHSLSERSASFNRVEIKQSARIKAGNTDIAFHEDVESMENLTRTKASAHHIRHSSLDSHPSALHPINLNSKFDHLCSPLSPAKASVKVPTNSDDQADKERSFFSASHTQREGGREPQEELSLEPHESLLQDAQEEWFSALLSAGSKSPREHPDFVLWGNAAFCLSEVRDLVSGNTRSGLRRQSEPLSGASIKNHVQSCEQSANAHPKAVLLSRDDGLLSSKNNELIPSRDEELRPPESIEPIDHLVASAISTMESSIAATEENVKRQSSVGSTLSVHDSATIRRTQAQDMEDFAKEEPLMSSEAQSCCLDFDAHEMEVSTASDCTIPAEEMQAMENTLTEINGEDKNEQEMNKNSQEVTQNGHGSSSHTERDFNHEGSLMVAEEVKIRAELEIEIERDLEQEIKTKIYLLNKRLEELTVLKATRHPLQEQSEAPMEEGSFLSNNEQEDHGRMAANATTAAPLTKSPPSVEFPKIMSALDHNRAAKMSARAVLSSSKKQLPSRENDKDVGSIYANRPNTPLTSWRKLATASGWAPHTKDSSSQLPSSDGSLKNIKISKHSIDGPSATSKPKVQVECTSSFKQHYQSWIGLASSKKFDWIRTLRSAAATTPCVSSMKIDGEESSKFLPSSKEMMRGNVARTLFTEDGLSTPRMPISKPQRRESSSTPLAGSIKKSVFSSTKTHSVREDMVISTPHIRSATPSLPKDNHTSRSASAKGLTKPPSGIQASRDLIRRTPEQKQAKVVTATSKSISILRASPQQASSKVSRTEKKTSVGAPASTNQINLTRIGSLTHKEKLKRSENGLENSSARTKEIKPVLAKTLSKQVSSPISKSRTAPPSKPVNPTLPANKTSRIVPSSNVVKRQSHTPLKMIGASTKQAREKVALKH